MKESFFFSFEQLFHKNVDLFRFVRHDFPSELQPSWDFVFQFVYILQEIPCAIIYMEHGADVDRSNKISIVQISEESVFAFRKKINGLIKIGQNKTMNLSIFGWHPGIVRPYANLMNKIWHNVDQITKRIDRARSFLFRKMSPNFLGETVFIDF